MKIAFGNIWDELGNSDLILITTNSVVKAKDGQLVMGAGAAKEAVQRFPYIAAWYGEMINGDYGVLTGFSAGKGTEVGIFQTKRHWRDPSDLDLINASIEKLQKLAPHYEHIVLNCPGIGKGQLKFSQVRPLLEKLPDNVTIYCLSQEETKL